MVGPFLAFPYSQGFTGQSERNHGKRKISFLKKGIKMKFQELNIRKLLGLGFGSVLILVIAVAILGYWGVHSVSELALKEFKDMLQTDAAVAEHSARARANVLGLRRFEKDIFLNLEAKEKAIHQEVKIAKSNGTISASERKDIRQDQRQTSRAIYRKKHNNRDRN